jgi:hypothetical protein
MAIPVSTFLPWEHVVWNIGKATDNILSSNTYYERFRNRDGAVKFKSERAYENVIVHTAKRVGLQLAEHYANVALEVGSGYINNVLRWFGHGNVRKAIKSIETQSVARQEEIKADRKKREEILKKQEENLQSIIEAGERVDSCLGVLNLKKNNVQINALDAFGRAVPEALFLSYETKDPQMITYMEGTSKKEVKSNYIFFFDVTAQVSQSTSKNIKLNQVEGRDFTRKELVSGGDICFSINGSINSNLPGVYPQDDVKRLIKICQYNGVVQVNHLLFKQFGVENIIIQDFKLGEQTYKNIQPYSITCVAVEPSDSVNLTADTIVVLNDVLASSDMSGWYKALLEQKKANVQSGQSSGNERNKTLMWLSNHI